MKNLLRWFFRRKIHLQSKASRWIAPFRRFIRRRRFILLLLLIALGSVCVFDFWKRFFTNAKVEISFFNNLRPVIIATDFAVPVESDPTCSHYTCFDLYRCNSLDDYQISVYVHPEAVFTLKGDQVNLPESELFHTVKSTIRRNPFYTGNPEDACVFVPPVDLLLPSVESFANVSAALASSDTWNGGNNHVIFTLKPQLDSSPNLHLGSAVVVGPGFSRKTYRRGFDIPVPFYFPSSYRKQWPRRSRSNRQRLLTLITVGETSGVLEQPFQRAAADHAREVIYLRLCSGPNRDSLQLCTPRNSWRYPDILIDSRFCLVAGVYSTMLLNDLLMMGCVPVILDTDLILPFQENLDWSRSVVFLREDQLGEVIAVLGAMDDAVISEMRETGLYFWDQYFSSLENIVQTALLVLNDRVFPKAARSYERWNVPARRILHQAPPLFLPGVLPKSVGFTAVVLTFDRPESLFQLIAILARCPSLAKILVIWNNQDVAPPSVEKWPQIVQPLKVIQTRSNDLNNRFVPYDDIETEAVLSLDDDILMLTKDEIEFGFQVWLEYSDRLVGFPSRSHFRNSSLDLWGYNSEWTSKLSMILTGASFYDKVYHQYYTHSMPRSIKEFVLSSHNCEDIAMNFLVANITGKGPIKLGPRKKFRCPECSNVDMLSADAGHLLERSFCINFFASVYGYLPLITAEYRADPVLYKEKVAAEEMRFPDIGAL